MLLWKKKGKKRENPGARQTKRNRQNRRRFSLFVFSQQTFICELLKGQ
jgi:hypothetical protein